VRSLLVAIAATAVLAALVPSTAGAAVKRCRSADLRYPVRSGLPNDFGVFKLRIRHGSCATAHRVAKEWMRRFEADLRAGHVKLPKRVYGFAFDTLDPDAAQTYNERGRKGLKTIRFDYRVPNG
jgi:hypothetical protein